MWANTLRRVCYKRHEKLIYFQKFHFSDANVIYSKLPNIDIPNETLGQYIWKGLDKWHDKTAIVCAETGRSYKYSAVYKKVNALAVFLRKRLGLKCGDTVAIVLPNIPEYPIILLAAVQAGLKVTTINHIYTSIEISKQFEDSQTKLVFTLSELWPTVLQAIKSINSASKIVTVAHKQDGSTPPGCIKFDEICQEDTSYHFEEQDLDNVVVLPYSSGTTGLPKGVQLTQKNIVSNLYQSVCPELKVQIDTEGTYQDVFTGFLPLFHIYGLVMGTLNLLASGCKIVTVPKFGSEICLKVFNEHKPTVSYTAPPIFLMLLNNPNFTPEKLQTLRTIVCGAAPLGGTDFERFKQKTNNKIEVIQAYGLTETSPLTHIQTSKLHHGIKIGGSGFSVPNTECKFVAADGESNIGLGPNESGELLIRGPQVMKGYHNNPEATKKAITEDGWFRTGDIGHYDEDEQFFITDRLKELIKVKGFQVAPAELEAILRNHPSVADAAVVGIPHDTYGEVPKAFIVFKDRTVTEEMLKEHVASKVAPFKRLEGGVVVVDSIPRTASGKILRRQLKNN